MILHRNLEFKTIINTFKLTFFSQPCHINQHCHSLFENIFFFLFFLLCPIISFSLLLTLVKQHYNYNENVFLKKFKSF
jgi:hypothetical protein